MQGDIFDYTVEEKYFASIEKCNEEALKTYPEGFASPEVKFCRRCGRILPYNTDDHKEGRHIEDCRR